MKAILLVMLLLVVMLLPGTDAGAAEEEKERLELGFGVAAARIPHYRGADQSKTYVVPIPYVWYEGDRLKVNREGSQFYLFDNPRFRLNLSAALAPPVNSEDNRARKGMPDLDPVFELGPRAEIVLYQAEDESFRVRLAFPFRQAFATTFTHTKSIGWVFSPNIQLYLNHQWDARLTLGPVWTSEAFHDYFYEVAPAYARAGRPAYNAPGGYSGFRTSLSSGRRHKKLWYGAFVRYDNLSGAVFNDSPLVKRNSSFIAGVALISIFYGLE